MIGLPSRNSFPAAATISDPPANARLRLSELGASIAGERQGGERTKSKSADRVLGEAPTIDFALVAVARALGFPTGSASALFALGRTVGWVAHALEQQDAGFLVRPRARYREATA